MTSVLQGGRRRRRSVRLLRLLYLIVPLAAVAAILHYGHHNHAKPPAPAPAKAQEIPGATPSPGTAAPDPAQAALTGVDRVHLTFRQPPRSGIVFDVKTGEVLWRRDPVRVAPIASLTKIMTA